MPVRRNRFRKKFGFVLFQEGYQAEEVVKWLDGAWLLDQRIMVKHARRKDNEQRWREVKHYERQNLAKTIVGEEEHRVYQQQNISYSKGEINKEREGKSYKQALMGIEVMLEQVLGKKDDLFVGVGGKKQCATVEAVVDEESLQRLENCVVGSANGWFDAE